MQYSLISAQKETLKRFSDFHPFWEKNKDIWEGEEGKPASLWGFMAVFSQFVSEKIGDMATSEKEEIFNFIEELLENGDEDVDNAVCTCFLEGLVNRTPDKISPQSFAPFLGKKSLEFCLGWGLEVN